MTEKDVGTELLWEVVKKRRQWFVELGHSGTFTLHFTDGCLTRIQSDLIQDRIVGKGVVGKFSMAIVEESNEG